MKKTLQIIILLFNILNIDSLNAQCQQGYWPHLDFNTIDKSNLNKLNFENDLNWDPILVDHFNNGSLDLTKWRRRDYEYQFPTAFNPDPIYSVVSDNSLKLHANWSTYKGSPISAGAIESIAYISPNSYLEARIKLNSIGNSYPAFWIYGYSCGLQQYNEIDIFEYFGEWNNAYQFGIHYCYYNANKIGGAGIDKAMGPICIPDPTLPGAKKNVGSPQVTRFISNTGIQDNDYHIYAAFYKKDFIYYYFDNVLIYKQENNGLIFRDVPIWLNNAIGDSVKVNGVKYATSNSNTNLPNTLEIDYIKVYKLDCDRNTIVNQIPNFNTFNWGVKRRYSLSNSTIIPSNANISLMAREWIEFNNGFEIPSSTTFSVSIIDCQ